MTRQGSGMNIPDGYPEPTPVTSAGGGNSAEWRRRLETALGMVHASLLEATPWMPLSVQDVSEYDSDLGALIARQRRTPPGDDVIRRLSRRLSYLNYVVKSFELHFGDLPLDLAEEYMTLRLGVEAIGLLRMRQDQEALIRLLHELEETDDDDTLAKAIADFIEPVDPSTSPFLRMGDQKQAAAIGFQVRHRMEVHDG